MEEFGKSLRYYRKQRRLTQTELAHQAGVAPAYVSQIESAQRMPSLKVARRFADCLKVDLPILLGTRSQGTSPDYLSDTDKLEALRKLIRSIEYDQDHRPDQIDRERYDDVPGVIVSTDERSTVRVYSFTGESAGASFHSHTGQEMVYCAAGRVRLTVDGEARVLGAGEVLTFDASQPHNISGEAGAVLISTVSPPVTADSHRIEVAAAAESAVRGSRENRPGVSSSLP